MTPETLFKGGEAIILTFGVRINNTSTATSQDRLVVNTFRNSIRVGKGDFAMGYDDVSIRAMKLPDLLKESKYLVEINEPFGG